LIKYFLSLDTAATTNEATQEKYRVSNHLEQVKLIKTVDK